MGIGKGHPWPELAKLKGSLRTKGGTDHQKKIKHTCCLVLPEKCTLLDTQTDPRV